MDHLSLRVRRRMRPAGGGKTMPGAEWQANSAADGLLPRWMAPE
jgi:hypothetical protein